MAGLARLRGGLGDLEVQESKLTISPSFVAACEVIMSEIFNDIHEFKNIDKEIDDALDLILKASGSGLKYYTIPSTLEKLRAAMLSVMKKSYIDGSNACHRVLSSTHN